MPMHTAKISISLKMATQNPITKPIKPSRGAVYEVPVLFPFLNHLGYNIFLYYILHVTLLHQKAAVLNKLQCKNKLLDHWISTGAAQPWKPMP